MVFESENYYIMYILLFDEKKIKIHKFVNRYFERHCFHTCFSWMVTDTKTQIRKIRENFADLAFQSSK